MLPLLILLAVLSGYLQLILVRTFTKLLGSNMAQAPTTNISSG